MNRNVVFWQFDSKRYYSEHRKESLVNPEYFGCLILNKEDDVRESLQEAVNGKIFGNEKYVSSFFTHHDDKNCERTVEAILSC